MGFKEKTDRFMELEGLRGIAAIVVVIYHFLLAFYIYGFFGGNSGQSVQHSQFESILYASPFSGLLSGTFAVSIFFVLSGFVLSIGFFQTGRKDIIQRLAAKRYIRLMLPALASLLICYIFIKIGLHFTQQASAITQSSWLASGWNLTPHLFDAIQQGMFGIFVNTGSLYNNVLWTMTTEFAGSFLVFGTLLLFAQSKFRWVVYIILLGVTFNTWFFGFITGMVVADLHSKGWITQQRRNVYTISLLLVGGIYLGSYPFGGDLSGTLYAVFTQLPFNNINYQMMSTLVGATIIVFMVLFTTQFAVFLRKKHIAKLGKYTFSLYLMHLPVLYTFTTGIFIYLNQYVGYNKAVAISIVLSIPVVWIVTVIFEKYIDSKSMKLSSYFSDVYFGKREINFSKKIENMKLYFQNIGEIIRLKISTSSINRDIDQEIE